MAASFKIAQGKAIAYTDGHGHSRLAYAGDESKLALSAEQIAAHQKKGTIEAVEPVEAEAATPAPATPAPASAPRSKAKD